MKFTLSITLGNAAMTTAEHILSGACRKGGEIAGALRVVADKVVMLGDTDLTHESLDAFDAGGSIRDANGNTVGKWSL